MMQPDKSLISPEEMITMNVLNMLGYIGLRIIVSLVYKAFWVFPVRNNRIIFTSYKAYGFTDNPKYLCQYMNKKYPGRFEFVFSTKRNTNHIDADYINTIHYKTLEWVYYLATSEVIVWNAGVPSWLTRRKKQLVIETWHGGGAFKRTDIINSNPLISIWKKNRYRNYLNLFVSSSQVFTQSNIIEGKQYDGKVLCCGMPRNDLLFCKESVIKLSEKVRQKYNLGDALCVLYAPTFREYGKDIEQIKTFPPLREVAEALCTKTGRNVVSLLRNHHFDQNRYDIPGVTVDVSDYPDMQELICCSDILITDYSSTMWDYALLGRPCYLFVPDRKEYERDRGFYTPIEEWPGIICRNGDELLKEIKEMNVERSRKIAEQYLEKAGSYEHGNAAEMIANEIIQHMKG